MKQVVAIVLLLALVLGANGQGDGGCSYRQWMAGDCPGQTRAGFSFFFNMLMLSPYSISSSGLQQCPGPPPTLTNGEWSCSAGTPVNTQCRGICDENYFGDPVVTCQSDGSWSATGACEPGCVLGSTRVRVLGVSTPIPLKDVKVGQRVQCMDTTEDFRLPTKPSNCEVMGWVHAMPGTTTIRKVHYTRLGGTKDKGATNSHFLVKLTDPSVAAASTATAASVDKLGSFASLTTEEIKPGDRLAVVADEANPSAGFTAAVVDAVEVVEDSSGIYLPAISKPFMVLDGVIVPLWLAHRQALHDGDQAGSDLAAQHYLYAPLWMRRFQPLGTPGSAGNWEHSPEADIIIKAKAAHSESGKLNFKALQAWFFPRYEGWKADASKTISVDDVVAFIESDGAWV